MPIQSGQRVVPGRVNTLRGFRQLTTAYTVTTTATDLAGTTVNLSTAYDGATYLANWSGDFNLLTAGSLTGVVSLVVDGLALTSPQAIWNPANVTSGARAVISQTYGGVISAGAHTFKLQATVVRPSAD